MVKQSLFLLVILVMSIQVSAQTDLPVMGVDKSTKIDASPDSLRQLNLTKERTKRDLFDSIWIAASTSNANPEFFRKKYLKILEIDPNCDVCLYKLAELYLGAGLFKQAYPLARTAYQIDSTNSWYQLMYARLAHANGATDIARTNFRKLLKTKGQMPEVWVSLANTYEETGDYASALGILDSMERKFGQSDDLLYRLHNIYYNQGDFTKALQCATTLAQRNPYDVRFTTLLADTYATSGNNEQATATYDQAINMASDFGPAHLGKAELIRKNGKFDTYFLALNSWIANPKIDPKSKVDYLVLILDIPSFPNYYEKQFNTLFDLAQTAHKDNNEILYLKAQFYARIGKMDEAIAESGRLKAISPGNLASWRMYTSLLYSTLRWNELAKETEKASKLFPSEADFYTIRAIALNKQNKLKEAIKVMEECNKNVELNKLDQSKNDSFIADLYFQSNKKKKAYEYYESAIKLDPNNAGALNNYAYYLSLEKKDLKKAEQMSLKSLQIEKDNYTFMDTYAYILYLNGKYIEARTIFRQAIAAGGNESWVILEHYADTLNKLGENSIAKIYWEKALEKEDCENKEQIKKKIAQ